MTAPLTVLIPTHGRPVLLRRMLESLTGCSLPDSYRETIVIENGSRDGAEQVVEELERAHPDLGLRYMHVEWGNKSHALNEALATVKGGLVVFFDDDVRIAPKTLSAYAQTAEHQGKGSFFGGSTGVDYEESPPDWLLNAFPVSALGLDVGASDWPRWFLGFNWAAHVEDLRSVGGFDCEVGPGSPTGALGQETTMQNRLKEQGCVPVPVPEAFVWHYVPVERSSVRWVIRRRYQLGMSRGRLIAHGDRENSIPGEVGTALRSLLLLPAFFLLRNEPRIAAHKMNVSRAVGLVQGYWAARRNLSAKRG